ncbi:MAG TPA: hypothetical protein VEB22_00525 [Phycisphaerales bacterium]|nr:hypothetical protein [Phycisphaerales bacterium]
MPNPFVVIAASSAVALTLSACRVANDQAASQAAHHSIDTPTREQTRAFLARLSITPETACAAGVTEAQVATLFEVGADTAESLAPSFESTAQAVSNARAGLASLRASASTELNSALSATIQQAEATLAAAITAQSTLWQTAFDTVTAGLPESTRSLLATLRANAGQATPTEFKAITREPQAWATLNTALQHARAREACGLQPSAAKASTITSAATDQTVYAAKQRLELNLPAIRAAWESAQLP